jgi:2,4-dienoyl-CoA reductase-like NADH-dependent reductase (Old Yellow Enzyme family)
MKGEKTAIGIQLAHGGRKASSQRAMDGMGPLTAQEIEAGAKVWQPVGPTSEPVAQGWLTPRQLTADECRAMVRTWAQAARNAVKAGFDVIEIHTAHGYLLASFLSPISNTRNDDYGGDRAGRMRLPLEIVEAVRRDTMPLFVRVSAVEGAKDGWNLDDTVAFARELKARGVDVIDCSSGGISGSATAAQVPRGLGFQVPYAERVRKEVAIATMAVGIILEAAGRSDPGERAGRLDRDRPAIPIQSQHRATLGPRSRHQPEVRGLDSRIWMVAREAHSNHRGLRHTDRSRQAADMRCRSRRSKVAPMTSGPPR